jgi:glucose-6-phosphate 1-dehydrogenase
MAGKVSTRLMFGATGDLARRMLPPSLYAHGRTDTEVI